MDERLVEAPSLRAQLHERLRDAILSGELSPGERLSATELARRFQVSTMPVRDALQLLEQEGLVETSARRWTRVVELDPALVEELVPIVSLLEQQAIATAPEPKPEDLAALRQANARFAAMLEQGDAAGAIAADAGFHHWLVSLAGNRSLERTIRDAELRLRLLRPRVLRPDLGSASIEDHERIVERLAAGDRAGAAQALAENWERGLSRYRAEGTAADSG
jgi:DNA-binding GntR family transcriptional regulator